MAKKVEGAATARCAIGVARNYRRDGLKRDVEFIGDILATLAKQERLGISILLRIPIPVEA